MEIHIKEIQPVHPKGDQSWVFIGRTDSEWKLQYFGHLMRRANSLEKTLMLGKTECKRRRGRQRMRWLDGIIQWTWVWVNSGSWWWRGRPGMLQSMGCKESDTAERLNWTDTELPKKFIQVENLNEPFGQPRMNFLANQIDMFLCTDRKSPIPSMGGHQIAGHNWCPIW